ncbi:SEC-C metal-binding domain-containing protein [Metabacillus malikii]|uniref:Uncharacterized protein YecA (UPF0149 family) n=1 Tax=Metabacillus malikii TaxID=1504265 RepID=A0ABT9ZGI7_9BACI|nr:SEC-C metal-binding domain-containing protein [Metabacillus malikii]MDQ0231401.1 uncharacterized protein YecA (UPF0149 family) [Metabacillus malikii]
MSVKRNDPCPCGSGKKYKKCCMKKEAIVQIQEIKEERFFQTKQTLVLTLKDFFNKQLSPTEYYQLQSEFKKRTNYRIEETLARGLFQYWLYFFHRFENGLRGIEWFVNDTDAKLSEDERQLAETWKSLAPQMVQAVNKNENIITFKNVFSNETYDVANIKDNVPYFAPWYGTITLLEPFQDLYYFNGVRSFEDPLSFDRAVKKVQQLAEETKKPVEDILIDYYPEVLVALVHDDNVERNKEREISEYILQFNLDDQEPVFEFLKQQPFEIDVWEEKNKQISWADTWYQYSDNQLTEPIFLAEVYGKIFIENNRLKFNSLSEERVAEFKEMMKQLPITLDDETTHTFKVPFQAEIRDVMVTLDKDTPKYFSLYAQNDQRFEFDRPLRQFDGLSIKELIESGRMADADNQLKQLEYNMYIQVQRQYGTVDITADYNSIRTELGLPLSPFVTGGVERTSSLAVITKNPTAAVATGDIETLEQLGFTPETASAFYTDDVLSFYKEKTDGKSEGTVRKYRSSLADLRAILEQRRIVSWDECNDAFWTEVIDKDFPTLHEQLTKTAIKDFTSTVKAFVKWLEKQGKLVEMV